MNQSTNLRYKSIDRFVSDVNFTKNKSEQIIIESTFAYKLQFFTHGFMANPIFILQIIFKVSKNTLERR